MFNNCVHCIHDSLPDFNRIRSLRYFLEAFLCYGSSQDCCCCCPISSLFIGIVGYILNQFRSNILKLVLQFNGFGNSHSILCNLWGSPRLFDDDIPSFWTHCYCDCISQDVYSCQHLSSDISPKLDILCIPSSRGQRR